MSAKRNTQPGRDNPLTIEDGSENATRRQLVQVLLRDVLRKSGIPAHWIECQMMVVSSRTRGSGMYVRLVIKHWDERLLNYALAFQNELVSDIARFEPHATQWLYGVSWQLDVGNTCPYPRLPDKPFWQNAEKKLLQIPPQPTKAATRVAESPPPTVTTSATTGLTDATPAFEVTQPLQGKRLQ